MRYFVSLMICFFLGIGYVPNVLAINWAKAYGGASPENAHSGLPTQDGGYISGGNTCSYGVGGDFLVIKLEPDGSIDASCPSQNCSPSVISPTPMMSSITLDTSSVLVGVNCMPDTSSPAVTDICEGTEIEESRIASNCKNEEVKLVIYPNPFTEKTIIRFRIPDLRLQKSQIRICIYDVAGRMIQTFKGMESLDCNLWTIIWDRRDMDGNRVPSGIYWCMLEANCTKEGKIIIVR